MAESTPRSQSASAEGTKAKNASTSRSSAARAGRSKQARSRSGGGRARSSNARGGGARAGNARRTAASNNDQRAIESVAESIGGVATKARGPMIVGGAAAAGAIGGLVLGARVLRPRKKLLGIPLSRNRIGLRPMADEVRKAGEQIARIAGEVGRAREQAQKVAKALR
jgi:hypothetical protein